MRTRLLDVHFFDQREHLTPVGWYWFNRVLSKWIGPFVTEAEARDNAKGKRKGKTDNDHSQ